MARACSATCPYAAVKEALVRDREEIPLLEDLLTAWPDVRINIDPKHDAAVDPLVDLIERTGTVDRVCIGAFSDRRLARMRERLGPRVCTSMGPRQVARFLAAARGLPAGTFSAAACRCRSSGARSPSSPTGSWPPPTSGACRSTCGP